MANAELLPHLSGGRRDLSIYAALEQLHVEANGGSEVAVRVQGSLPGRALQVAVIGNGEDHVWGLSFWVCFRVVQRSKHQHATRVAVTLAYPALPEQGLETLESTTSKSCVC
jgi:hypothetical protein